MKKVFSFFFLLGFTMIAFAQQPLPCDSNAITIGKSLTIKSAILNETRAVNIYLPYGYEDTTKTFPVIYLLDGSANEDFVHIAAMMQFMETYGIIPPTILVGIGNVDRQRDFTHPTSIELDKKDFPTTGGSEKFMSYVEKELVPWTDKNYRTNTDRLLIGQSLGGLMATEFLLKKPGLFNRYLIVSPSLWWDNESLLNKAPELLATQKEKVKVYIAVGEKEEKRMIDDGKKLSEYAAKTHTVEFVNMKNETHATILHNAAYRGLEYFFRPKE